MIFVEHIAFRWADKITVIRDEDKLHVYGRGVATETELKSPDLLDEYAKYAASLKPLPGQLSGGRLAAHIRFANANADGKLIDFVKRYGPVNGVHLGGPLSKRGPAVLEVTESLQGLRRERMVFAAMLRLNEGLRKGEGAQIANALGDLIDAWSQPGTAGELRYGEENLLRLLSHANRGDPRIRVTQLEGFLRGLTGESVGEYGWYTLCLMLSAFPAVLVPTSRGLIEMPPPEKAGILPALFFMLRRDCLLGQEVRICERRDCGHFFKVERGGQRFCTPECSQLQRQRDYWQRKGKEARATRVARTRNGKGRKMRGAI